MSLRVPQPTGVVVDGSGRPTRTYGSWFTLTSDIVRALVNSGTTAQRPTVFLWPGRPYFDTTLGKPVWWDGSQWVDATGASA